MAPRLSESTRAKVSVLTSQAEAAAELRRHLGAHLVPAEFGGPCTWALDDYPAQRAMLELAASLSAGGCAVPGGTASGGGAAGPGRSAL
jgi:hypothetical protein